MCAWVSFNVFIKELNKNAVHNCEVNIVSLSTISYPTFHISVVRSNMFHLVFHKDEVWGSMFVCTFVSPVGQN